MSRTLLTLAAATLLAAGPARANPESEVAPDYDPRPVQIVEAPRDTRWFGVPNAGEFEVHPPAAVQIRLVPYPDDEPIQERGR